MGPMALRAQFFPVSYVSVVQDLLLSDVEAIRAEKQLAPSEDVR